MAISKEIADLIRKYAIKNAMDYGKAEIGSVLGKVIPQAKGIPVQDLKKEAELVIVEVNKMKKADLKEAYKPFEREFEKKAEETARKTEKPNLTIEGAVKGKVVTRLPPGPNGYMHIGHVKQALLSSEVAKLYEGKFYRFFDDTNPEKDKQEYVDAMMRDHEWLGLKFNKTYYSSDFVEKIYSYAKKLIGDGNAYVCMCSQDEIKEKRENGIECKHRKQKPKENMELFGGMLNRKFNEGEAVVRLKGDMKALNGVMRDPVLLRIVETPHYRTGTKYAVWPVYDFNTPIVDSLQGVTDVIRSKEFELRAELGQKILEELGLRVPRIHVIARLNIKGNITAKRILRKLLEEGKIKTWDDPRLMTIMALRRRGIAPEAIRNFVLKIGMTKTDSSVPFEMLLAENKKVIDPVAKHLFFVPNPFRVVVENIKGEKAKLSLQKSWDLGFREFKTGNVFYISKEDADLIGVNETVRLKDLIDIKVVNKAKLSITSEKTKAEGKRIVQWVADNNYLHCTVMVPGQIIDEQDRFNADSLKTVTGYVEGYARELKEHEIVQFERFGYCILDDKKKMQFIFISK